LLEQGWRVCVVWECALRGRHRLPEGSTIQKITSWLRSEDETLTI
jgi:DNA mismatch endonuclease (patch repair protein)